MKRLFFGFLSAILLGGVFAGTVQAQDVNNFTIQQFEADYYLSQDSEGRSQLKTVEKITAEFPDFDQNHGLERAIPKSYDDHSTSLTIESITDENDQSLPYSEHTSNDNLVLRIGDPDTYVHGQQTYIITHTQRDVTRYFANTNDDEFYWDVNGTQWQVPIDKIAARVHVDPNIVGKLTGQVSCYLGSSGSNTQCDVRRTDGVFSAEATDLSPRETMTLALGFAPHTFTEYQPGFMERLFVVWQIAAVLSALAAAVLLVWLGVKYHRIKWRKKIETIVPEYLPPKNASVLVAAQVMNNGVRDVTAQLIDLAVRHYLKIYQTKEKTLFHQPEYELELTKSTKDLRAEERRLLEDLFGAGAKPGDRFKMKELQKSYALRKTIRDRRKAVQGRVRGDYAIFERAKNEARWFYKAATTMLIIGAVILSPFLLIAAIVVFVLGYGLWPLTEKGAKLHAYLEGLKLYIKVAEEERLKMLQSPEGAEKVGGFDQKDPRQLVKLYERVLPYAILFGQEKQWVKYLGAYYEEGGAQPSWYSGHGAFNAAMFGAALSGFSQQATSYSASASSSAGGAGGGGSAGGGGGGGGGGGF